MTNLRILALGAALLAALACSGGAAGDGAPVADSLAASAMTSDAAAALRLVVAPEGNSARYRVREQLLGRDFPNDAVGETSDVAGAIALDSEGRLIADASRLIVGVGTLTSDSDRRDGYVRRRLLVADTFPSVEFVPREVRGLPTPLSAAIGAAGEQRFELVGDLTVKGVTRPTTWQVTATHQGGRVTGSAATAFTFEEFQLEKPRVRSVLSVADTIRLEYDFTLVRDTTEVP